MAADGMHDLISKAWTTDQVEIKAAIVFRTCLNGMFDLHFGFFAS